MVRYLKVNFKGPKDSEGLYCTLTHLKVFGRSMHAVMQDSLMDLVISSNDRAQIHHASQPDPPESEIIPRRKPIQTSISSDLIDSITPPEWTHHEARNQVSPALDHIFTGKLTSDGICMSIPAEDTL
jgi:hypothetical protein